MKKINELLPDGEYDATVTGNEVTVNHDGWKIYLRGNSIWVKGVDCPTKVIVCEKLEMCRCSSIGDVYLSAYDHPNPTPAADINEYINVVVAGVQEKLVITDTQRMNFKRTSFLNYSDLDQYVSNLR